MSSRKLNARQQKLFEEHLWLVDRQSRIFLKRQQRFYPRDEVLQIVREGLWYAAWLYRPPSMPFGMFASKQINWHLNGFYFGQWAHSPGSKASRQAVEYEIQGSSPIAQKPEKDIATVMDLAGDQVASREIAHHPGDDRKSHVLSQAWNLSTLDARERRVLRLRFDDGLELDLISAKIGFSIPVVKRIQRSAIRKLRAHFESLGYKVLPLDQSIQNSGNRSHWTRRAA